MNLFIIFSVILAPCSDDFAVMCRYFFSIRFGINLSIDFDDLQGPKMDPWDNILGQGATPNHRPLPIGPPDLARHGSENGPNTILIDFCMVWGRFWCYVWSIWVEDLERRRRKRQNDANLR